MGNNGEISDKYQTIVTPFGTSFSIKAGYCYPIMTAFQAGWTISFSYEIFWLSLVFMYGILATLIAASMSLQTYKKTMKGYLLWQGPFSIQTGWIMAASAVMTNVLPVAYGASVTVKLVVASMSLAVLVVTAISWLSSYPVDLVIPFVILWALGGVYGELQTPSQLLVNEFTSKQIEGVQCGVLAGLVVVGVGIVFKINYVLFKQRYTAMAENKSSDNKSSEKDIEESAALESDEEVA